MRNYIGCPYHQEIYVFTDKERQLYCKLCKNKKINIEDVISGFAREYVRSKGYSNPDVFDIKYTERLGLPYGGLHSIIILFD